MKTKYFLFLKIFFLVIIIVSAFSYYYFSTKVYAQSSTSIQVTGIGKSIISAKRDSYIKALKYFIIKLTEDGSYKTFENKINNSILNEPQIYIISIKILKKEKISDKLQITAEIVVNIDKLKSELKKLNIKLKNEFSLKSSTGILSFKYLSKESINLINSLPQDLKIALYQYLNNLIIATIPSVNLIQEENSQYVSYAISVINDYLSKNSFEYLNYEYYIEILNSLNQYETSINSTTKDQKIINQISQKYGSDIIILLSSLDIKYKKNINSYNVVISAIIKTFDSLTGRGLGEKPLIVEKTGKNLEFTIKSTISYAISKVIDDILERTSYYFIQSFKDGIRYKVKLINNTSNKLTPMKIKFRNLVKNLKKTKSFESKTSSQNEIVYYLYYLGTLDQFEQELFDKIKNDKIFKNFDTLYKIHNSITFIMDNSKNIETYETRKNVSIKEDSNPPKIVFINPENNSTVGTNFTLLFNYIDQNDISKISINLDNKGWETINKNTQLTKNISNIKFKKKDNYVYEIYCDFSNLNIGMHIILIKATDSKNNESKVFKLIFNVKDLEPPKITITSPINTSKVDNTFLVKGEISELSKIKSILLKIDSNNWKTIEGNNSFQFKFENINEGNHLVYIKAIDANGNESEPVILSLYVTDLSPPEITSLNIKNGDKIEIPYFLSGKIKDFSKIKNIFIKIDDSKWISIEFSKKSFNYLLENINTGNHTIYIKAEDVYNNISQIISIKFDIIKTSNKEFSKKYEIPDKSIFNSFVIDKNGFSYILTSYKSDIFIYTLFKTDKNGKIIWKKTFSPQSTLINPNIYPLKNFIYIIGTNLEKINGKSKYSIRIIKLNSDGSLFSDRIIYSRSFKNNIKFIIAKTDNISNLVILARYYENNLSNLLIKIENDEISFIKKFKNFNYFKSLEYDKNSNTLILTGYNKDKIYILQTNFDIDILNSYQYKFNQNIYTTKFLSYKNNYYIYGKTKNENSTNYRSFLIQLDSNFDIIKSYKLFSSMLPLSIFKNNKDNIFISGIRGKSELIILKIDIISSILKGIKIKSQNNNVDIKKVKTLNNDNFFFISSFYNFSKNNIVDINIKLTPFDVQKYSYRYQLIDITNLEFEKIEKPIINAINSNTDSYIYITKFNL